MFRFVFRAATLLVIASASSACEPSGAAESSAVDAIVTSTERTAEAIDAEYRALDAQPGALRVVERTRDRCSRSARDAYVLWVVGGHRLDLPVDASVYFEIDGTHDAYTATGGWYWSCSEGMERTRIRGARIVRAFRDAAGFVDWWALERATAPDAGVAR